ncbi:MAG: IS1 family transposase, partial [Cyanobacteriota bacterium]|nr:IS1 family transposase [Cyanobacteriota bacterium]MEB3252832.1 IS1 family transposase [Cyanobacteriota bacterium]
WGLAKQTTPAMAIGLCSRPLSTQEILCMSGFRCISS